MTAKERWIIKRIPEHGTDILDTEFVDDFIEKFQAPHRVTFWGANKCPMLNRLLARMYKKGILKRGIIGLGNNWQPGFPRWVYAYSAERYYKSS